MSGFWQQIRRKKSALPLQFLLYWLRYLIGAGARQTHGGVVGVGVHRAKETPVRWNLTSDRAEGTCRVDHLAVAVSQLRSPPLSQTLRSLSFLHPTLSMFRTPSRFLTRPQLLTRI
jgi:hypothetical protein